MFQLFIIEDLVNQCSSGDAVSGSRRNISAPTLVGPGYAITNFGNQCRFHSPKLDVSQKMRVGTIWRVTLLI